MPLMKSKSPKAFAHNIKAEMNAGKSQPQSLAIAYNVKRKAKKMAEGGKVNESAVTERRPMPSEADKDSSMVSQNSGMKPPMNDSWTSNVTVKQAQKPSLVKLSQPPLPKATGPFSVRYSTLRTDEDDLQSKMPPSSPKDQPSKSYDEEDPDKMGSDPEMSRQHNNGMKPYAKGGMINGSVSMDEAEEDRVEHPKDLEEDDDQIRPAMSDYMEEHDGNQYAEGGMAHEMDDVPEDEADMDEDASMAAAIMSKRKKMAKGGEILSEDSIYSFPEEDQADLARNAEEDANMGDRLSFDALRKENYSESEGLRQLDSPSDSNEKSPEHEPMDENDDSTVSRIRRRMNKSPMTK